MGIFISLSLILLLFLSSCSNNTPKVETSETKNQIDKFEKKSKKHREYATPALILPNPYEDISVFGEDKITLSAQNVKLGTLLHTIAYTSGLNLIIDNDVDSSTPITISVNNTNIEDVLDIVMDISQCYYKINGNILHIKEFMRKNFSIAYMRNTTSFKTALGGDILNSAYSGGGSSSGGGGSGGGGSKQGIKGNLTLDYDTPEKEEKSFYTNLESNVKVLLSSKGQYTLNRFSGVLSVYDKKRNIDAIETMINDIKKHIHKQILIEAKILEVVLNKGHSLGVSWESVMNDVLKAGDTLLLQQSLALSGAVAGTMTYSNDNFSAVMSALNTAGDVDTLSNPRIKVLSGQSAIISSGKLVPFWEKEVQTTQGTGGSASNTEVIYNRRDVLNGLTMGVTPTIMENGQIMLNIIPITSNIEDIINYTDEDGKIVATAPLLNIKEAGTVIYAKNNDLVLIGGLISNNVEKKEESIPYLGSIPYIGTLFRKEVSKNEKRELVILIRVKVIE